MRKPAKQAAKKPAAKSAPETLARAITEAPRLVSAKATRARLTEWLDGVARTPAGKALNRLVGASPKLAALLAGIAESSPYLWDLASSKPSRLRAILESDPAANLDALLAKTERAVAASNDEAEVMRLLRRMKSESALLIALADIGGVWPVMHATTAITALADTAIRAAAKFLLADAVRRGKLKPVDPAQPEIGSGLIVLAMGKMGANELNYSSDIDLIVLYDAAAPHSLIGRRGRVRVRITRALVKLLQSARWTDTCSGSICDCVPTASTKSGSLIAAALDYYGTVGQNGARGHDKGARMCRRYHGGRSLPARSLAVLLAQISRF